MIFASSRLAEQQREQQHEQKDQHHSPHQVARRHGYSCGHGGWALSCAPSVRPSFGLHSNSPTIFFSPSNSAIRKLPDGSTETTDATKCTELTEFIPRLPAVVFAILSAVEGRVPVCSVASSSWFLPHPGQHTGRATCPGAKRGTWPRRGSFRSRSGKREQQFRCVWGASWAQYRGGSLGRRAKAPEQRFGIPNNCSVQFFPMSQGCFGRQKPRLTSRRRPDARNERQKCISRGIASGRAMQSR